MSIRQRRSRTAMPTASAMRVMRTMTTTAYSKTISTRDDELHPGLRPGGSGLHAGGHGWRPELRHAWIRTTTTTPSWTATTSTRWIRPVVRTWTVTPVTTAPWSSRPMSPTTAWTAMPTASAMPAIRTRMATATPMSTRRRIASRSPTRWIRISTPVDTDGDLICDTLDPDDDNDGPGRWVDDPTPCGCRTTCHG